MPSLKIIVAQSYDPVEEAQSCYQQNSKHLVHIASSTSLKTKDLGEWAKAHFVFDKDCPKSMPDRNFTYCELASLYAGASLKEVAEADYIGLCHYRRLFSIPQVLACIDINKPDIICSRAAGLGTAGQMYGVKGHYALAHVKEDFDLLEGLIKESSVHQQKPETYETWSKMPVLVAPCNCFIMKREMFLDFTDRMFRDLGDIYQKRREDILKRDNYQRRAIGFLGERFTSWYTAAQHFLGKEVIELPMEFHENWKPKTATDSREAASSVIHST